MSIDNRYGSVKLAPWDKEEVQLRINIKVDAGKLERSEEIMEEIEIEFDTSANAVSAITHIGDINRSWWTIGWGLLNRPTSITPSTMWCNCLSRLVWTLTMTTVEFL